MKNPCLGVGETPFPQHGPAVPSNDAADAWQRPPRIGIIGGGQLARMTALAAVPLGVEVVVLERDALSPAVRIASAGVNGDWSDPKALLEFAGRCDVITLENEFVDAGVLALLERRGHRVFPSASCVALTQDKWRQKETLQLAGLPVAGFRAVASPAEVVAAGEALGWPLVLKTRRNGYDGKGNFTVRSREEIGTGWRTLQGDRNELLAEAFYPFERELAVIVTRGRDGSSVVYPVVETIQRDHVCHRVKAPAAIPRAWADRAASLARGAIEAVDGVGSFGVELFLSTNGDLAINELAPRVHNSGHYTLEACECSQFENHVRAVLGWPLGSPRMVAPAAAMANLLGTGSSSGQPQGLARALRIPGARVHLYGKATCAPGRKMGHITVVGDSLDAALAAAESAAREIWFGGSREAKPEG